MELPLAAHQLAVKGDVDAIICLGAVIRGATAHFDYVASSAATRYIVCLASNQYAGYLWRINYRHN